MYDDRGKKQQIYNSHKKRLISPDEENKNFDPTKWKIKGGLNDAAMREIDELFVEYRKHKGKEKLYAELGKYADINGHWSLYARSGLDEISYAETGTFPTSK